MKTKIKDMFVTRQVMLYGNRKEACRMKKPTATLAHSNIPPIFAVSNIPPDNGTGRASVNAQTKTGFFYARLQHKAVAFPDLSLLSGVNGGVFDDTGNGSRFFLPVMSNTPSL